MWRKEKNLFKIVQLTSMILFGICYILLVVFSINHLVILLYFPGFSSDTCPQMILLHQYSKNILAFDVDYSTHQHSENIIAFDVDNSTHQSLSLSTPTPVLFYLLIVMRYGEREKFWVLIISIPAEALWRHKGSFLYNLPIIQRT